MSEIINILIALAIYDIIKGIINYKSDEAKAKDIKNLISKKPRKPFAERMKEEGIDFESLPDFLN